jgi:XTP/dITP diphosphohydrolase
VPSASSPFRPVLVIATLNRGKAREPGALLGDLPFELRSLADVPGAVLPEETGESYAANALAKARAGARLAGALALADDSGLEGDALAGAPGIHSARYGGPDLDDAGRCRLLLEALAKVAPERRTARFRCVIALADPAGWERTTEGVVEGIITTAPRGQGGFGYDPLFYYPPLGRTFAELSPEEKARVDHRGIAARAARRLLAECYTFDSGG